VSAAERKGLPLRVKPDSCDLLSPFRSRSAHMLCCCFKVSRLRKSYTTSEVVFWRPCRQFGVTPYNWVYSNLSGSRSQCQRQFICLSVSDKNVNSTRQTWSCRPPVSTPYPNTSRHTLMTSLFSARSHVAMATSRCCRRHFLQLSCRDVVGVTWSLCCCFDCVSVWSVYNN